MCRSNDDKICQGAEYIQGTSLLIMFNFLFSSLIGIGIIALSIAIEHHFDLSILFFVFSNCIFISLWIREHFCVWDLKPIL